MHPVIADNRGEIAAICRRYRVQRLEVFGSAARGTDFDPESSDADFLVAFEPPHRGSMLRREMGLIEDLQAALGREVDMLSVDSFDNIAGSIKNEFLLAAINECREVVYDSKAPDGAETASCVTEEAPVRTDCRLRALAMIGDTASLAGLIADGTISTADVNTRNPGGRTPLHIAARWNDTPEMISFLLGIGADPAARDQDGMTPLEVAHREGHDAVIRALEAAPGSPAGDPALAASPAAPASCVTEDIRITSRLLTP